MHSYPQFNGSYVENQQALLYVLGLNSPSQAPFRQIQSFWSPEYRAFLLSSDGSEREDLVWLRLAFSVIALHHRGEWPEINQSREPGNLTDKGWWRISFFDEPDLRFLSEFFAETWETLCEQHPSIRNLAIHKVLYFENRFDTETEDGLARLIAWLRWIVEALWENQGRGCFSETDADVQALQLIVDLLGKGELRVIKDTRTGETETWVLRAIHLIRNTGILPGQTHAVMTSYSPGNGIIGPAGHATTSGYSSLGFTPFAQKFDEWGAERFQAQGLQVGFHTYVHPGAYIGRDITIGHGVVIEAGASISDGVIIGDQAYIGVGVYVEPGAHIGIGVKLLDAKPGESPVVIGNRVCLEPGVIIFPDTPMIPSGATLQAGIILRPSSIFQYPEGTVLDRPSPHSSIGPGNRPNTLIVQG